MRSLAPRMREAVLAWERTDPVLASLARTVDGVPDISRRHSGFDSLVTSLIHQQVSIAAGASILRKVRAACGGRITPRAILAATPATLRAAGLSRQKQAYVRDLAVRVAAGEIDFRRLARMTDGEVVEALTRVKGIGVWTAKMFLLFHMGRPDVVSPEDLGLRIAVSRAYRMPMSRTSGFLERQARKWSPYGSLASLALWASKHASDEAARRSKSR